MPEKKVRGESLHLRELVHNEEYSGDVFLSVPLAEVYFCKTPSSHIHLWLYSPCGSWPLFQFLNPYTVRRTPWTGDQPDTKPLPTYRTTQTQNKHKQTPMPRVAFEPTIPVSERAKTVHGRSIAQAVSRWLPTAAARLRAWVWSSGICGGQSGAGAGFLRVLRFPLPIFIPPNSPSSSQSRGAGTTGHSVADVPSGPSMDSNPPLCELKKRRFMS
jgi:hypothetical protein